MASMTIVSYVTSFRYFKISATFAILTGLRVQPPAVRSTTREPFSAAAFATLARFESSMKTDLSVSGRNSWRGWYAVGKRGGGTAQTNTEFLVQFVKKSTEDCLYFSFCEGRDFVRDGFGEGARCKVPEPWVTDSRRLREGSRRGIHTPISPPQTLESGGKPRPGVG